MINAGHVKKSFLYGLLRSTYVLIKYSFGSYLKYRFSIKSLETKLDFKNYKFHDIKSAFYWVFYLTYISIFKNVNNTKKSKYFNEYSLNNDGFARLKDMDHGLMNKLISLYLKKTDSDTLDEYFASASKDGYTRPTGINLLEYPEFLKEILDKSSIVPIVKDHLGLEISDMHVYCKFDTLINLSSERVNTGHDDALEFHRDHDSVKAVKAFFYLNDVFEDCGHHELYLGSHRKLPLRLRPIKRYHQNDIESAIDASTLKKVTGKAGYGFIENTSCLHRGCMPIKGNRVMITLSFNDSISIKRLQRDIINGIEFYAPLIRYI